MLESQIWDILPHMDFITTEKRPSRCFIMAHLYVLRDGQTRGSSTLDKCWVVLTDDDSRTTASDQRDGRLKTICGRTVIGKKKMFVYIKNSLTELNKPWIVIFFQNSIINFSNSTVQWKGPITQAK